MLNINGHNANRWLITLGLPSPYLAFSLWEYWRWPLWMMGLVRFGSSSQWMEEHLQQGVTHRKRCATHP